MTDIWFNFKTGKDDHLETLPKDFSDYISQTIQKLYDILNEDG